MLARPFLSLLSISLSLSVKQTNTNKDKYMKCVWHYMCYRHYANRKQLLRSKLFDSNTLN